jgi:serine/threonine-protein kinase RsbT
MATESESQVCDLSINTFEDLLIARKKSRLIMETNHFSTLDQTKFITAISELLRNALIHAGKGIVKLSIINESNKAGIKCTISDNGPGIPNIPLAMTEGYSTVGSLGLGLSGAKKLSDEFSISSTVNVGTTIQIIKWR